MLLCMAPIAAPATGLEPSLFTIDIYPVRTMEQFMALTDTEVWLALLGGVLETPLRRLGLYYQFQAAHANSVLPFGNLHWFPIDTITKAPDALGIFREKIQACDGTDGLAFADMEGFSGPRGVLLGWLLERKALQYTQVRQWTDARLLRETEAADAPEKPKIDYSRIPVEDRGHVWIAANLGVFPAPPDPFAHIELPVVEDAVVTATTS